MVNKISVKVRIFSRLRATCILPVPQRKCCVSSETCLRSDESYPLSEMSLEMSAKKSWFSILHIRCSMAVSRLSLLNMR